MSTSARQSLGTIDAFLNHVGATMSKTASAPLSEAGSIGGETSHPVKSVDDRLQKAKEGERSAENSKDVKDDQGPPSVENAGENKSAAERSLNLLNRLAKTAGESANPPGTAADDQLQIGTNKQPTGEDPANETNKAKAGKEDPGSSHPARTDNDSLDGHKYAYDANTPLSKIASDLQEIGEDLCARLEVEAESAMRKTAAAAPAAASAPAQRATQPVKQASALDPRIAQQLGWEIAGILDGSMDKTAADRMVKAELAGIVKEAFDDADNVAEFFHGRQAAMRKRAEAGMPPAEGDAGGAPGGDGDMDDAGAGAAMAGAGPGPGAGGAPSDAAGPGGPGGGAVGPQEIQAICQELGCSPEDLLDALMQTAGGGPQGAGGLGGAPGPDPAAAAAGGGAMPPAPAGGAGGAMPPGMEVAAADKRAHVIEVLQEIVRRSKR